MTPTADNSRRSKTPPQAKPTGQPGARGTKPAKARPATATATTPGRRPSVAAGAARAAGERARRHTTPLVAAPPATEPRKPRKASPAAPTSTRETPRPQLQVIQGERGDGPDLAALEELAEAVAGAVRWVSDRLGLPTEQAQTKVAETLAFLRRRVTGDFTVDEFGFDPDYAEHVLYPLLRPLYRTWFRTEVLGIDNIPATGAALIVGNHSGTVAIDSLMTQLAIHDTHPQQRALRALGADLVFATPFLGDVARKGGSTLAANADAERLLNSGELVGVWPEGFKGVGKPFRDRYRLQRFGRGGCVATALRAGVPIIPCATVGAEETYPMLGNLAPAARLLGLPYLPITPTFPWLGPLGMVPLPSKWLIEFGTPIDTSALGPAAADDPAVVFDLTDRVRETIQQTLYSLLMQRRSVFW